MHVESKLKTKPASHYSIGELAAVYNETRTDYIVPMPMSPDRLAEYMLVYDVDAASSCVVSDESGPIGLGMLGLRPGEAWITRMGVSPKHRRAGAGSLLMTQLLAEAARHEARKVWLEVIKGNTAAQQLFLRHGFSVTRELLVIRRSPMARRDVDAAITDLAEAVRELTRSEAIGLLESRSDRPNWLNETASMRNCAHLQALMVHCRDGGQGWASFDVGKFQLTRVVVDVIAGDPVSVAAVVLQAVHQHHPRKDTFIENVAADDPKWPGFQRVGYFDAFRRIEMVQELTS